LGEQWLRIDMGNGLAGLLGQDGPGQAQKEQTPVKQGMVHAEKLPVFRTVSKKEKWLKKRIFEEFRGQRPDVTIYFW
jgi:hypothetical protein